MIFLLKRSIVRIITRMLVSFSCHLGDVNEKEF